MRTFDNDNEPEMSPLERGYAFWSEDPAIRHLIYLVMRAPNRAGLDALVQSAFEAGWTAHYRYYDLQSG